MSDSLTSAMDAYDRRRKQQEEVGTAMDPIADAMGRYDAQKQAAFTASATLAIDSNPDEVARQRQLASKLGVPVAAVEALPDEAARKAKLAQIERDTRNAAALRLAMSNPEFARLAHDDTENLSLLEQGVRAFEEYVVKPVGKYAIRPVAEIIGRTEQGFYGLAAGAADVAEAAVDPLVGRVLPANPISPLARQLQQFADEGKRYAEYYGVQGNASEYGGVVDISIAQGIASAGQNLVLLPFSLQAQGVGMAGQTINTLPTLRSLAPMGAMTAGQSYTEAKAAGLSLADRLAFAGQQGGVEMVTEALPLGRLLTDIKANSPLLPMLAKQLTSENIGEQVATHWQDANEWLYLNPDKSLADYLEERSMAALQTAIATTVATGLQTGAVRWATRRDEAQRAEAAERQAQHIEQFNQRVAASKVLQRDADTVEKFVESATAEGADSLYIGGRELMQSGVGEAVARLSPTAGAQLEEALATGGQVRIPLSEYTARIAGTEYAQALVDHLKVDPEGFSRAEAREYLQTQGEQLKAEVEQVLTAANVSDEFRASQDALKQAVLANLNEAGRFSPQTNEVYAELIAARTSARAARLGLTPEALFAKDLQTLRVRAEGQAAARVLSQGEGAAHPFAGFTREQFLGSPRITSDANGATLRPRVLTTVEAAESEPFAVGNGLTAKYSEDGAAVFDGDKLIASYNFGDTLVVDKKYRRQGIAEEMVYQWRTRNPQAKPARERTRKSQALQEKVWARIEREMLDQAAGNDLYQTTFDQEANGATPYTADTIEVDGKTRPAVNSSGQRIAQTEEGLRAFWRWFGDSKVVDAEGRPLVVYHGTMDDIEAFEESKGVKADPGWLGRGFYFTTNPDTARYYAVNGKVGYADPNVLPVYLKIENPYAATVKDKESGAVQSFGGKTDYAIARRNELKGQGFDGVMLDFSKGGYAKEQELVAFDPTQIKSAIGNRGTFDPANPNILYQSDDYRGEHRAPGPRDGAPGHDLTGGGQVYPDDVYTHGRQYYGTGSDLDAEAFGIAEYLKGRPGRQVKIYRAVPYTPTNGERADALQKQIDKYMERGIWPGGTRTSNAGVEEWFAQTTAEIERLRANPDEGGQRITKINPGDWVAITRGYAKEHGESVFGPGNYKIISKTVTAKEIFTNGDSIQEWGYWPEGSTELAQDKADPRGSFNPDSTVISLLKGADLSTFLHEGGHYFFEADIALASEFLAAGRELTEGEQGLLRDVSTLLKWHGIQGTIEEQLRQWHTMSFAEQEAAHERTAESFEAYLFEGIAPSIELAPYFQKFRGFLTRVYSSLKAFLQRYPEAGKLDDTVRAVFDRMLATDEQIALAQQARSMQAMFRTESDAQAVGMTPEEFAAYQAQDAQRVDDAAQDLQAKALRDLQWTRNARAKEIKKLQRKSAETRREVRMAVRREVMSQPVYRAWQFLTSKITADDKVTAEALPKSAKDAVTPEVDSLFVAIAKLGGITKDDAADTWGITDKINPPLFGKPVLRATGGYSIDAMAEKLGELGYLTLDRDGKVDVREFEELFGDELRGSKRYSNQVDGRVLMEQLPGANVNIGGLNAGRLDEGALLEMGLDDPTLAALRKQRMVAKDGLHPDLVAPYFEFGTGIDLVEALASATPPQVEIEGLTDARMLGEYGELATPEAIERQADIAIHNEARARMVVTEANALAKATGQRKIMFEAAKQYASEMIARLRVRDVRPAQYTSAAARAGKLAEKAMRKGDLVVAGAEKRNQVLNTVASRQAYDAIDEVEKGLRYLKKFASDGVRQKLDVEYLDQIDGMLERFDLRAGQSLKAIDKRATLAEWVAGMEQEGLEPDLPAYILAEANRQHYRNLTVEQFRELVESVQQVEHLGRLKKRLLTAKDQRELDAIVESIKERIEESSGGRIVDNEVRNTAGDRARQIARGLLASHRKAASVVRELDGFKDGGPLWEYLIRGMNESGDREATLRAEASKRLQALAEPILKGEKMGGQGRMFPMLGRRLNRGERLAIALNWGNESNRQRLMDGRGWSDAQMQQVLSSLSAEEWTFVQGVWDFFESYRPEIAAKERRVYGKEPKWIDPAPFTVRTADGQDVHVRGGYYPIKYDPRQSGKAAQFAEAEEAKGMMRAAYTAATTRRSFTKGRAEKVVGRPLLLTFDGIWQGANEVIHDLTWHEWLIDANRLVGRLDSTIRQGYGAEKVDVLRKAIKDSARGDIPASNQLEKVLTHLRNGTSIVGMGWNLTTALLQPLGLTNSVVRVGGTWMAKGLSRFYGSPLHMAEVAREVQAMSPMMASRAETMNREIADVRNQLTEGKSQARTAVEASFFVLIQKMQAGVDYPTWLGAYEKAIADPANLNPDGTINDARAIALADQAVIDAQGGGQIKDLAEVQRGHPAMKLFTNFYSYFNVLFNLTYERTAATDFRRPKEVAALMGDYLLLMVIPAVLSAVLRDALKGGDDDDEELKKKIAAELVGYPLGMFVLARDLAGAAQLAAGVGEPAFGYSGPAGLRFFAETQKLAQQANQGEVDMALFKAANNSAGILFHYPAGQVNRLVDGTAALIEGETRNPLAPLVGPASK